MLMNRKNQKDYILLQPVHNLIGFLSQFLVFGLISHLCPLAADCLITFLLAPFDVHIHISKKKYTFLELKLHSFRDYATCDI